MRWLEKAAGMHPQFTGKCSSELPKKQSLWLISGKFIENFIYFKVQRKKGIKINYNFFKIYRFLAEKLIIAHGSFIFSGAYC